jgi:alkanesulfonate monooxygenase SsuD/methylene tetrahydromethanopterin reductase-like flavin-dependent oxidoreductase (luciferase family)
LELGVYTFSDISPDPKAEGAIGAAERLRNLIEEIELADQVGSRCFRRGRTSSSGLCRFGPAHRSCRGGRAHQADQAHSAVTVLSSDDPVRVYQQFTTIDLLSGGRAEIMAGRGSFIESFPLFGYDLNDYDELFSEKLDLLLQIRDHDRVNWRGRHRAPMKDQPVYPRPERPLPIWVAVGGNPPSVVRAATLGLPMALAIIGGMPERFAPFAELYRETARRAGHDLAKLPLGISSHGFVAEDSKSAGDIFFPSYAEVMSRIGAERGWPPTTRQQFCRTAKSLQPARFSLAPPEIAQNFARGIVPRRAGDAAAGMGPRAAHIEPCNRRAIIGMAEHGPRRKNLRGLERAVKDVAADEAEGALQIERAHDLPARAPTFEVRRVAVDRLDHQVGDLFAAIVPGFSVGQVRRDMLAEQARDMLALRRERVVERRRITTSTTGFSTSHAGARIEISLLHIAQARRDDDSGRVMFGEVACPGRQEKSGNSESATFMRKVPDPLRYFP